MDAGFKLKIASPCSADWAEMDGDERTRFCGQCKRNVFNISSMTRSEAEALVSKTEGRVCGRFWVRDDGTVLTADCRVGWRARMLRRAGWAAGMVTACVGLLFTGLVGLRAGERAVPGFLSLQKLQQWLDPVLPKPQVMLMGEVCPVPPPPPPATPNTVAPAGE